VIKTIKQKIIPIYNRLNTRTWFALVKILLLGITIAFVFDNLRYWGLAGILLILLGYPIYNYIKNRQHYNLMYLDTLHRIEKMLYGKIRTKPRWSKRDEKRNKRKRAAA